MRFLFLFPLLLSAQTVTDVFAGPTYGTKIGMVSGFQIPVGAGINNFNIIELKFNRNAQPLQSVGFGFSKSIFDHSFSKDRSFHILALTTAGLTSGANATTSMFNGGFICPLIFGKFSISFGFLAQSGAAKGNLYGIPLGYIP